MRRGSWFWRSRFWALVRRCFTHVFYWEFWPMYVFHFPTALYYLWLSLRSRSFFYFSAANPSMWLGGMKGESKRSIYSILPQEHIPFTYFFKAETSTSEVRSVMSKHHLTYPIVLKPDVGERGKRVNTIHNDEELSTYLSSNEDHFILQSYVDYPIEVGLFYYRIPNEERGRVSALTIKKPLFVRGDGQSTVEQLMQLHLRTNCAITTLKTSNPKLLSYLPKPKEFVMVAQKGTHAKGSVFLNGNKHITPELVTFIDQLSKQIPGFYYGRFDIRCCSLAGLAKGADFKIIELNGTGGEPSTIYDPRTKLLAAYKQVFHHMNVMYRIACMNHKRGVPYTSLSEVIGKGK